MESHFVQQLVKAVIDRRKQLGLTQRDLSELAGVLQPVIARLERGLATPRVDTLLRLASAMGLKELNLVFEDRKTPTSH